MRTPSIIFVTFLCCSWLGNALSGQTDPDHAIKMAAGLEIFKSDVRTIFSGRCIKCHNQTKSEGSLDLSTRESLLKGGDSGSVIEIGQPDESYLIQLVKHDEEPTMPAEGARLDDRQIDRIARWIELGTPYDKSLTDGADTDPQAWINREIDASAQDFWSFKPLQQAPVPRVENDAWSHNDIDRFILQRLSDAGILPNPRADRRALIRRAYFDLIGLPPSPEQVAMFIGDDDPQAYEKLIDRLLENPHHGERWGRHWLDVVRFAESFGFEQDYDRPYAYPYRDFVIKAFNADMPFDQFVQWQLAGDEFAPHEPMALMATGFMGAGVFPTQLTEKEFESARYDELDDMVSTTGTGFLGLTIGCARCHDHKFDPIPMRDYYQMVSVFGNTIRSNVEIEINPESTRKKLADWETAHQAIVKELSDYEQYELPEKFQQWMDSLVESVTSDQKRGSNDASTSGSMLDSKWIALHPVSAVAEQGTTLTVDDDAKIHASGANPESESFTIVLETGLTDIRSFRLEAFPDSALKQNGPGRAGNGNFALGKLTVTAEPLTNATPSDDAAATEVVKLIQPRATYQQNDNQLSVQSALDADPKTGWAVDPQFGQRQAAIFDFEQPVGFPEGTRLIVKMEFSVNAQHSIGVSRLSITKSAEPLSPDEETVMAFDAELNQAKDDAQRANSKTIQRVLNHEFKYRDEKWRQLVKRLHDLEANKPERETVMAMICSEGVKPIPHHGDDRGFPHFYPRTYFLSRGDANQKLAIADPGFLQALTPLSFVHTSAVAPDSGEPSADVGDQEPTAVVGSWDLSRWQPPRPSDATTSYRRRTLANWMTDTQAGAGNLLRASDRQPPVAASLWTRACRDTQRFWFSGIASQPPPAARRFGAKAD